MFGPTDLTRRGGTIAFYLVAPDGRPYDVARSRQLASRAGNLLADRLLLQPRGRRGRPRHHARRHGEVLRRHLPPVTFEECAETLRASTGKAPNTMRVSLGLASNFADACALVRFAR